jgi:large subunit ribosomal protein L10
VPRAQKEARVKELADELSAVPAAVLAGYRGLTVQEAAELRAALDEVDTRFSVVKNSLVKLAVEQAGLAGLVELIDGPTAVAFVRGDVVAASKRLVEQARRFPVLEFRGGFAEGRIITGDEFKILAALEPREVMLAKVAGLGKMQISRAAWMFQGLQSRFVGLMNALRDKLPGEESEVPEPEAAPAEAEPAPEPGPEPAPQAEAAPEPESAEPQEQAAGEETVPGQQEQNEESEALKEEEGPAAESAETPEGSEGGT